MVLIKTKTGAARELPLFICISVLQCSLLYNHLLAVYNVNAGIVDSLHATACEVVYNLVAVFCCNILD